MWLGCTSDVQVDQLVEERLQDVTGPDPGIGRDGEPELARHGEPEPVRPTVRSPHLELGLAGGEGPVGEYRQLSQPFHLIAKGHPGDEEIGRVTPQGA